MAYITQKRLPLGLPSGYTTRNGLPFPTLTARAELSGGGVWEPYQQTTSWRTGKSAPSSSQDDTENAELAATTSFGVINALASEQSQAKQSRYDNGHTFSTTLRQVYCTPDISTSWTYSGNSYGYDGNLTSAPSTVIPLGFGSFPSINSGYYGPDAISKTIPTNPLLDLTVALAELKREGFPKPGSALWKLLSSPSDLHYVDEVFTTGGEEYLAYQFGLKPVLADLAALKSAVTKAQSLIFQHVRDSGKLIRRKYTYPIEKHSNVLADGTTNARLDFISNGLVTAAQNAAFVGGTRTGKHFLTETFTRQYSFSGAYTYHLPSGKDFYSTLKSIEELSNMLVSHRLTAGTIYNLAPWSWLIDWNINIGTNIANADSLAADGLVIAYGYLMCEDTRDYHSAVHGPTLKSGESGPFNTIYRTVSKNRVKATPFGFGLNPNSFTARQWAILAALGYTKGGNTLRTD